MKRFSAFLLTLTLLFTAVIVNSAFAAPWKFGVMCDTQWLNNDDGKNPNTVAIETIKQLNQKFIAEGVKFVVQTGDLTDKGDRASYTVTRPVGGNYTLTSGYTIPSAVNQEASKAAIGTRAMIAQELYNANIGFFPLRGNHEETQGSAQAFTYLFPQTQNGNMNATPSGVFNATIIPGSTTQTFPSQSGSTFPLGSNFSSPAVAGLTGLSYSFDYDNARFVLLDQFTRTDGSKVGAANTNIIDQLPWFGTTLAAKPVGGHAFVFSHKNLMGQNHVDMLFGANPSQNLDSQTTFIDAMYNNGARYSFSGHDHIYQHSLVKAPGSTSAVHNIIAGSDSNKYYIPTGNYEWLSTYTPSYTLVPTNPAKAIDNTYVGASYNNNVSRETTFAQERYKIAYFIVTVDGTKVTTDYYSADNTGAVIDTASKEYMTSTTPTLNFTKKDTFGYDLTGHEYQVPQGSSYTVVDENHNFSTIAKILAGTNNSTALDGNGRQLVKNVSTLWTAKSGNLASEVLTLLGMTDLGQTNTDTFVLSMSYDPTVSDVTAQSGLFGLAVKDRNGNWENAVIPNTGGTRQFVVGPWNSGYALGTYGVDTDSHTAWAVINHNSDFAVSTFATFNATVTPSGTVPAGKTATITSVPAGINCTWNGTSSTGTCSASNLTDGIQVVLNAALPAGTTVAWGAGCDSTTATSCTINSLMANTTINATFTATAVAPTYLNIQSVTGNSVYLIAAPSSTPGAIYNFLYNNGAGWTTIGTPSSTRNPTFTLPDPGVYQFQVYVTASGYNASPNTTTVGSVSNTTAITPAYLNIQAFNAAASSVYLISAPSATPGAVYNFEYNKDGLGWTAIGTPSATRNPTFILPAGPGSYQFRVYITATGYTASSYRATVGSATVAAQATAPAYLNVQSFNAATGATYLIAASSTTPGALYSFQYRLVGDPTWTDFSVASPVRNPTITVGSGTWEFQVIITAPNGYTASVPKAANITVTR